MAANEEDVEASFGPEKALPIFGTPLYIVMKNQGKGYLPFIVQKCMMFLKDHLSVEGLFRVAGSDAELKALRAAFDQGENVQLSRYTRDPHTVASLLKLYLASLPDSLVPAAQSDQLIALADSHADDSAKLAAMRAVCDALPEYAAQLLECLLRFLREVVARSAANKMTVENLGVVFGPTLMRRALPGDYAAMLREAQAVNGAVALLLAHVEQLFGIRRVADFQAEYRTLEKLGAGAFATVWLVESRSSGQRYAAKVMRKSALDSQALERLGIEVDLMRRVRHPAVIALKTVCETADELVLVMELAEGGDLFHRLKHSGRSFTEDDVADVLSQLLRALEYLHAMRIVHRDLKPDNILLKRKDALKIKIADFGLSKLLSEMSRLESVCGTPLYVAPEVLAAEPRYGPEVDMWSVGVIAYALLTGGDVPFRFATLRELFDKIQRADVRYDPDKWATVSQSARDFVARCLVADPAVRLTAAAALKHRFFTMRGPSPSVITWMKTKPAVAKTNSHEILPDMSVTRPRSATDPAAPSTHRWQRAQFNRATWCDHCTKFIWGVVLQGMQCSACKLNVHSKCKKLVRQPCTSPH